MTGKKYGPDKLTIEQMQSKRQDADAVGDSHYFTGEPCKNGHISPRTVSWGVCTDCLLVYRERQKERRQKQRKKTINLYGPDKLNIEKMRSNKEDARKAGHSHYFTGRPCKYGHLTPRTTGNATCVQCASTHSSECQKRKNHKVSLSGKSL